MASDEEELDLGGESPAEQSDPEPAEDSQPQASVHSSEKQSQHSPSHHSDSEVDMGSEQQKPEDSDQEQLDMGSADEPEEKPAESEEEPLDMGSDEAEKEKLEEEQEPPLDMGSDQVESGREEQQLEQGETGEVQVEEQKVPEIVVSEAVPPPSDPAPPSHPEPSKVPTRSKFASIPVLAPESTSRDTYDMDLLLDPRTQRKLASNHRFMSQLDPGLSKPRSISPPASHNFVKDNITRVSNTKSSMRVSLDNEHMSAGILMFSPPKEPRKEPVDIKHLWEFRTRAERKTDQLREELKGKEIKECPFVPSIIGPSQPRPSRTSQEYYTDMLNYKQRTNEKLRRMKEETDDMMEGVSFKPELCAKSVKMAGKSTKPRYEMLYSLHKGRLQSQIQGFEEGNERDLEDSLASEQSDMTVVKPFQPVINKRSHQMVREVPVEEYLYQEAFKRAEKMRAVQPRPIGGEKLISSSSETLLIEKFQAELDEQWQSLEGSKDDISYMNFVELLLNMSFIENNPELRNYEQERDLVLRAWRGFGVAAEQRVGKRKVELMLYGVMNFWTQSMAAPVQPTTTAEDPASESLPKPEILETVGFYTTPEKISKAHSLFRPLYEHRMWKLDKSTLHPTFKFKEELPFRPTLDKGSEKMAEETRMQRGDKIEDVLIAETQRRKERHDVLKTKIERDTLKECKFRPETNRKSEKIIGTVQVYSKDSLSAEYMKIRSTETGRNEVLYKLAAVAQERKKKTEKTPSDLNAEDNMVECTFAPNLSATRETVVRPEKEDHKGTDKAIERMKKAREDAQRVKLMTERGFAHTKEVEPVRFTIDHKHKLIPKFDPNKATEKKQGNTGKGKKVSAKSAPVHVNQPTETQGSGPGYSEIRETSSEEVKSEEPEPILTISVALSETERDTINYYAGDKVEDLARKFVVKHGLPESDVERLTQLINSKMQEQESS